MKATDAAVNTEIAAAHKIPRLLFELALSGLTLRYAADMNNIVFPHGGAVNWTAKAVEFGGIAQSLEGQIGRITVKFDNITSDMAAYANTYVFEGTVLTIKRIFLDSSLNAPANADYYNEVFCGPMERIQQIDRQWLTVSATTGKPLGKKALLVHYNRPCGRRFGDDNCNVDGNADLSALTASGTADSGTTTTLVHSGLTQADDHWIYGKIAVTKSGVTYLRRVKDFDAAADEIEFDLALPVAVDGSTTYQVWKGCDHTWATCGGANAWGPSADNQDNFFGFMHIGQWRQN